MSLRLKLRRWLSDPKSMATAGLCVGVALFFQNCADPLNISEQDSESFRSGLPFAYNTTADTLAYMSCSNMSANHEQRAYFTFRAGAYTNNAGLKLSNEFVSATSGFNVTQRNEALQASTANQHTLLQLAVRKSKDFQSVLSATGSGFQENKDFDNLLRALDSTEVGLILANLAPGQRAHFFPTIPGLQDRLLEGSLRFLASESGAQSLRTQMNNSEAMLTFTYSVDANGNDPSARAPDPAVTSKVFGTGYVVNFIAPNTSGERRVLDTVREVDLLTGATTGSGIGLWDCPREQRWTIVRPEDKAAAPSLCFTGADAPANATAKADLEVLRRVLRVEDYWADPARKCVVPKPHVAPTSCYGTAAVPALAYFAAACSGANCPHYVSICLRR